MNINQFNQYNDPNQVIYAELVPRKSAVNKWLLIVTALVVFTCVGSVALWLVTRKSAEDYAKESGELISENKLEEALQKIERAVKLDKKETVNLTYRRAWLHLQLKNYEAAMKDAKTCIDRNYVIGECEKIIRDSLYGLRRFDEAIEICESIYRARRWPTALGEINTCNWLAWCYAMAGKKLDRAMTLANKALRIARSHRGTAIYESARGAALDTRAYIYYLQGKYSAALKDINEAIKQSNIEYDKARSRRQDLTRYNKSLCTNHYHRALIYDKLNQNAKAAADRAKVRDLGSEPTDELHF